MTFTQLTLLQYNTLEIQPWMDVENQIQEQ